MAILNLVTPRMYLRPFDEGDAVAAVRLITDPDVVRFMKGAPVSLEEVAEAIRGHAERSYTAYGLGVLAGVLKSSGSVVGRYGLQYSEVDGKTELDLSYVTDAAYRGQGLATEAVHALLEAAGREGFDRVVAWIMPENVRSQRLAERCGLQFERDAFHKELLMKLYAANPQCLPRAG